MTGRLSEPGRGRVVVAGALAQKPRAGGHTWVFLQYLLGLRALGWDVLFLDQLPPEQSVDASGQPCPVEDSVNLAYFLSVMRGFGLDGAFALICGAGERFVGLSRPDVLTWTRQSALLLNVMGFLSDAEILGAAPRRVFLDIDPGFGQMWRELGLADPFRGHDAHVTIGENVGRSDCAIPTCGLGWITTPQPVVLDAWACAESGGSGFTSVATWRGAYGPVEYRGRTYGLRAHELRRFAALPRLSGRPFELALDIHPADAKDRALLDDNGWRLVDPKAVAGDPWAYRRYIHGSCAEFNVAKNMYVQSNSGWFSDRSICYLASGKPVLAQDTGLAGHYPIGEGLLTFTTLDEAVEGVVELARDGVRHARAARALAEEYFASDRVLSRLLAELGVA
jgi:hypothetical protein